MASIFPSTPTVGEVFTSGGTSWQWNGEAWTVISNDVDVFTTIATSPATQNVVADSLSDTLTLAAGSNVIITGNSATDTITIATTGALPTGGSAGQILAKLTGTNYDATWIDGGSIGQSQDVDFVNLQDGDLFVYNGASALWQNKNLFIHNNHDNIAAEYLNGQILLSASPMPKANYGTASPSYIGLEREVYYQVNEAETEIIDIFFYLNDEWLLYNDEAYTWATVNLESWQWLIDNSSVLGWEWLVSGAATPGGFDYKSQFVPNIIANIKYQQKQPNGDVHVLGYVTAGGSAIILNTLQSGSANTNGGLRINRGTDPDVEFRWNEQTNTWEFTNDGSIYKKLGSGAVLYDANQPDITDLEVGTLWIDSNEDVGSGFELATFARWTKVLSGSTSLISGVDDNGKTLSYSPDLEKVFINGALISRGVDYTASNSTSITLTEPAFSGDIIEVHSYESFSIADTYTKSQVDNNFLTKGSASSTYLTQANASATYIDFNDSQLVKYGSSEPSSPATGTIWIDSTNITSPITKVYNGSTWIIASGADAGLHPFFMAGI